MVKGKARKSDTGQKANALEPPIIQVDKTLPELPREDSFGRRTKAKVQGFLSHLRPSHSRSVSRTPSEDRNNQVADQTIPESVRKMEKSAQEGSSTVRCVSIITGQQPYVHSSHSMSGSICYQDWSDRQGSCTGRRQGSGATGSSHAYDGRQCAEGGRSWDSSRHYF
ncbi:hypothetical protein M378DRAFT_168473 [Amanita muscaria Koide BX008]|uniref:Uncharacterized protein n=1 Tax=Amanita muscaria (strain Koide BX008) TaxID=946122 RepID=A0A0C2SBH2_AMAMK|nr:hypothetical protein M378DRAFT_168473 [Amanita muscaria Koide BX008]